MFMPDVHAEFEAAFKAGRWFKEEDPGPWLGRTVIYKLQLFPHFDRAEAGPTISCPFGYFTEGYMQFPELGTRFLLVFIILMLVLA